MKKHKLVNWQGQMKVSSSHFRQTEDHFIEELSDARSLFLHKYDYGLLPLTGREREVEIRIREYASDRVEVSLYHCNAVTVSGERICFSAANDDPLSETFSPAQDAARKGREVLLWDIILTVDPHGRVATGEIDPHEDPPRHPDCESLYRLHIVPSDELDSQAFGAHFLTIGKVRKEGSRCLADPNYIPPSRSMSSHPELAGYCKRFDGMLYRLHKSSRDIVAKVNGKPDGNVLATDIRSVCETVYTYISSIHFQLRNFKNEVPPVAMAEHICTLASLCHTRLGCLPSVRKDELLKYFYEWSGVTPGSFEELLAETMEMEYTHERLRSVMVMLEAFTTTLSDLWEHLSRLEYIGQHKENFIISVRGGEERDEKKHGFMVSD